MDERVQISGWADDEFVGLSGRRVRGERGALEAKTRLHGVKDAGSEGGESE